MQGRRRQYLAARVERRRLSRPVGSDTHPVGGRYGGREFQKILVCLVFSSRRRHTRSPGDWSSDVCSSDLGSSFSARSPTIFSALEDLLQYSQLLEDLLQYSQLEDLLQYSQLADLLPYSQLEDLLQYSQLEDLLQYSQLEDLLQYSQLEDLLQYSQLEDLLQYS